MINGEASSAVFALGADVIRSAQTFASLRDQARLSLTSRSAPKPDDERVLALGSEWIWQCGTTSGDGMNFGGCAAGENIQQLSGVLAGGARIVPGPGGVAAVERATRSARIEVMHSSDDGSVHQEDATLPSAWSCCVWTLFEGGKIVRKGFDGCSCSELAAYRGGGNGGYLTMECGHTLLSGTQGREIQIRSDSTGFEIRIRWIYGVLIIDMGF